MAPDDLKKKISLKNENLYVIVNDKKTFSEIKFSVSNMTTLQRAQTLFTKEPVTIQWIRSFKKGSIFFDIGANIGTYTLFAAIISKTKVFSFEPESSNYYTLMENIILNNLIDKVSAYPIGLSNKTEITSLFMNSFSRGGSHHMVGESLDHNLKIKKTKFKQGVFSTTLDDLISRWKLPIPNYLKIDVDGIEFKIIEKSKKLLKNNNLHSVLIEINPNRPNDRKIIKILLDHEFKFDQNQVNLSTRKSGVHKGYAEYLFSRNIS